MLIIPAFYEEERLADVLRGVAAAAPDFEVVVVDDGSGDATAAVARRGGATVIRHPFNLGYGAALQTGYKYARRMSADLVVQMDADGQHDAADIPALAAAIESDELDLVIGSRFLGVGDYQMDVLRRTGRAVLQALIRAFGLRISDPTSGFQALGRRVLDLYVRDSFPSDYPDVDVLLVAHRHGLRIGEHAVAMAKSERESTLHGGLAPVYYAYKMLLSLWAASSHPRSGATREGTR